MTDSTRQRLRDLTALLREYPDGLTTSEIGAQLGVSRQTALKDIERLSLDGVPIYEDGPRYVLDSQYQKQIDLSLAQAWFMYLPLRRIVRAELHRFPLVKNLLYRVASLFHEEIADQLIGQPSEEESIGRDEIFTELVWCWKEQQQVELLYRRPNASRETRLQVEPWWFEPAVWSDAFYLVCGIVKPDGDRDALTLKLDRIQSAHRLTGHFQRPSGREITEYLQQTWGIWVGDKEPVTVKLRFHPFQLDRLRETSWHPSQSIQVDENGFVIWQTRISEPQEMVPWIRGWGADVEVLEPLSLRRQLVRETQKLAQVYGVGAYQPSRPEHVLWAKYDSAIGQTHLLLYHLTDVAQVALVMWEKVLSQGIKRQLAEWLGLEAVATGRLMAFWAGLHDIGKASPVFQYKKPGTAELLENLGLTFRSLDLNYVPHNLISAYCLPDLLKTEMGMPSIAAEQVAWALGGHHGTWPSVTEIRRAKNFTVDTIGDEHWMETRRRLLRQLEKVIAPPHEFLFDLKPEETNTFLTLLTGFTSVVDWVGSMQEYFPYEDDVLPPEEYAAMSHERADQALSELGWIGWHSSGETKPFRDLFPYLENPNTVQQEVIDVSGEMSLPALAILEAPTGIGKTEAALYLADRWLQSVCGAGLYIAMPTQATSNQMFGRVLEFLHTRYPHELVNYHLLHGQAQWIEDAQQIRLNSVGEDREGTVAAMGWFLPRKRSLLAPFAVGTVDQALMSILLTKHFFVRLFGLSHKVVVFDEVHAYDTYMSTLFHRLLEWLRQINTSVIILSATLPEKTRTKLIQKYAGDSDVIHETLKTDYPRLTVVDRHQVSEIALTPPPTRTIAIEWIPKSPESLAARIFQELTRGGCCAVIGNTVRRVQDVFRALADMIAPEQLTLFHAQFPFVWREEIEWQVLEKFGKQGQRPKQAVLVATQVIEQSLDLDFDLMITDLAPIDLILQRAGRLHRHERPERPERLKRPRLLITEPDVKDGIPDFGGDTYVYDEFTLAASMLALEGRTEFLLPDQTTDLIEFVYGEAEWISECPSSLQAYLQHAQSEMKAHFRNERSQAHTRMVLSPDEENLLSQINLGLEEDNPEVHEVFQAMTRLISPAISVVCLHQTRTGITLEPDGTGPIDPYTELTRAQEKQLLQRTVAIRHSPILRFLEKQQPPGPWIQSPSLQHHRLIVFHDGQYRVPGTQFVLRLSQTYGLEIRKEDE